MIDSWFHIIHSQHKYSAWLGAKQHSQHVHQNTIHPFSVPHKSPTIFSPYLSFIRINMPCHFFFIPIKIQPYHSLSVTTCVHKLSLQESQQLNVNIYTIKHTHTYTQRVRVPPLGCHFQLAGVGLNAQPHFCNVWFM